MPKCGLIMSGWKFQKVQVAVVGSPFWKDMTETQSRHSSGENPSLCGRARVRKSVFVGRFPMYVT